MYRSSGAEDVNVPALPVRRSSINSQSASTPQLTPRHQTFVQQRSTASTVRTSSSSSRLTLANLNRHVDSSRSRKMNDYRDFPNTATSTSTTAAAVRPGDSRSVGRSSTETDQISSPPLLRDIGLSEKNGGDGDDNRAKKENKKRRSKVSECRESIICQRCGRCRCRECARHITPTGRRAVEICSCVSCVRRVVAVRRHQQHYDGDDDQEPCACSPCRRDCCRRWALLVVLSVCLPCLCFYWPLRCVVGLCSRCAGRQARGCHCVERHSSEVGRTSPSTESVVIERVTST